MKPEKRAEARRLRAEEGMAMKAIARKLEVSVGSVSVWTRDIELTPEQIRARDERDGRSPNRRHGTEQRSRRARLVRIEAQEHGRAMARVADPLHLSGCMLYWGEGTKSRNTVGLTNSDADIVRCF